MFFIGDVHGHTGRYIKLLKTLPKNSASLQVGDMGIGFKGVGLPPPGMEMRHDGFHKFIRGNHDSPQKCKEHPNYAGEYGIWWNEVFFLGGAWSIDQQYRTEGVSWWRDEEQSEEALDAAFKLYAEKKPRIVATHEAPTEVAEYMLNALTIPGTHPDSPTNADREKDDEYRYYKAKLGCVNTRTSKTLQRMLNYWAPSHWVFGHYHVDKRFSSKNTEFICLAELSICEL